MDIGLIQWFILGASIFWFGYLVGKNDARTI